MFRFVILEHDHPQLHWDLMLESGATLRTWRLASPPTATPFTIPAQALADHRLAYLDYEGAVSGNRGQVVRWDAGLYEIELEKPGAMCLSLKGERIRGPMRLRLLGGAEWAFEST